MQKKVKEAPLFVKKIIRSCSGFTLIELATAIFVLFVLIAISVPVYSNYVNRARVTVAASTLDYVRKTLETYYMDNNKYPETINFATCVDEQGHAVFSSNLCEQIKKDIYSVENYESYVINDPGYRLKVRAKDTRHTLLTLTASKITKEGN